MQPYGPLPPFSGVWRDTVPSKADEWRRHSPRGRADELHLLNASSEGSVLGTENAAGEAGPGHQTLLTGNTACKGTPRGERAAADDSQKNSTVSLVIAVSHKREVNDGLVLCQRGIELIEAHTDTVAGLHLLRWGILLRMGTKPEGSTARKLCLHCEWYVVAANQEALRTSQCAMDVTSATKILHDVLQAFWMQRPGPDDEATGLRTWRTGACPGDVLFGGQDRRWGAYLHSCTLNNLAVAYGTGNMRDFVYVQSLTDTPQGIEGLPEGPLAPATNTRGIIEVLFRALLVQGGYVSTLVLYNLAVCFMSSKRFDDACEAIARCIELVNYYLVQLADLVVVGQRLPEQAIRNACPANLQRQLCASTRSTLSSISTQPATHHSSVHLSAAHASQEVRDAISEVASHGVLCHHLVAALASWSGLDQLAVYHTQLALGCAINYLGPQHVLTTRCMNRLKTTYREHSVAATGPGSELQHVRLRRATDVVSPSMAGDEPPVVPLQPQTFSSASRPEQIVNILSAFAVPEELGVYLEHVSSTYCPSDSWGVDPVDLLRNDHPQLFAGAESSRHSVASFLQKYPVEAPGSANRMRHASVGKSTLTKTHSMPPPGAADRNGGGTSTPPSHNRHETGSVRCSGREEGKGLSAVAVQVRLSSVASRRAEKQSGSEEEASNGPTQVDYAAAPDEHEELCLDGFDDEEMHRALGLAYETAPSPAGHHPFQRPQPPAVPLTTEQRVSTLSPSDYARYVAANKLADEVAESCAVTLNRSDLSDRDQLARLTIEGSATAMAIPRTAYHDMLNNTLKQLSCVKQAAGASDESCSPLLSSPNAKTLLRCAGGEDDSVLGRAAVCIQRHWRGRVVRCSVVPSVRARLAAARANDEGALAIWRAWVQYRSQRIARIERADKWAKRAEIASCVQQFCYNALSVGECKWRLTAWQRQQKAAAAIQRSWRHSQQRERAGVRERAARSIQNFWLAAAARRRQQIAEARQHVQRREELRSLTPRAKQICRWWSDILDRRKCRSIVQQRQRMCLEELRRQEREYLVYLSMGDVDECYVRTLCNVCRGSAVRRELGHRYHVHHTAARRIARCYRRWRGRQLLDTRRAEREQQAACERRRQEVYEAAACIQRAVRAYIARLHRERARARDQHAYRQVRILQCFFRRTLSQRKLRTALGRRELAHCDYLTRMLREYSATRIQASWRMYVVRRDRGELHHYLLVGRHQLAARIQRAWRSYDARQVLATRMLSLADYHRETVRQEARLRAIIRMQSIARMHLTRVALERRGNPLFAGPIKRAWYAVRIQARWRGCLARKWVHRLMHARLYQFRSYQDAEALQMCAMTIQRAFRQWKRQRSSVNLQAPPDEEEGTPTTREATAKQLLRRAIQRAMEKRMVDLLEQNDSTLPPPSKRVEN